MSAEQKEADLSSSRIYHKTKFDSLLKKIGEFGKFQKIQWFLLFLAIIPQSWYTYAPAFAVRKVKADQMSCGNNGNISGKAVCEIWHNKTYCGDVKYQTDFTSVATDWDIICEDAKAYIPLTKTIFYAGKLVGAYLFGWISDRYGRRVTLLSTMFIQFLASLIQSFSVNFTMYVILRVPLGVCSGGTLIAAFALMAEMVVPDKRNWANTLVQSSYGVGIAIQALLAYLVREWKPFSLTITIPNVLFVLYFCYVPESPRWLAARGRFDEAKKILCKIAKTNGHECDDGDFNLLVESEKKKEADNKKTYYLWHLFSTRYLFKITVIEGWSWLVVSGVYYGLSFNSGNLSGDFYLNFAASGLVEIPAYIIAGYLVDRINRRIPLMVYYISGGIALLCIIPIQALGKHEELSVVVMVLALIGKFFISAAYYQVYIHAAELYPTVIRSAGVGFASLCGRIGGMAAPYVADSTPLLAPAIIFGGASMSAGIITFFLPETRGKPLPDHIDDDAPTGEAINIDPKDEDNNTKL
ncbi:organic cation transporter-like protein [Exaiptasia diaphana]|uniref:Major facilitator superfamily (MFS) profile domain-containing protein n=1 Tax=Exaiptasia diaphana TaxID=2652724 RepID=A0A913X9E0_EXADI|nr:organic cation transporter-like protein [Exaiptasia diaphana]KXJ14266.1 Solute carrier family 22 member 5 [Exaiptasia diaphana]